MPNAPQFRYFLYGADQPVQPDSEIWAIPIPLSRKPKERKAADVVSHGDYFSACRDFLTKDDFKTIVFAVSQQIHRPVTIEDLETIHITLEKHGEFYHPARVEMTIKGLGVAFVLNVAVSKAGKNCIKRECRLLTKLIKDFPFVFLPKVFGQEGVFSKSSGIEIRMFLGEWFGGYNEFHLSRDPVAGKLKIRVWDLEHGNFFLTADQTMALYRQATKILTYYFNLETFEHIYAWHHAAGDFVVKCENGLIDVKLISVRQYGPMFANDDAGRAEPPDIPVLESLLVFFLGLAIRMRLDRLDGTGAMVWADKSVLQPVLKGFCDGLTLKPKLSPMPETLIDCFREHMLTYSWSDLLDLNQALLNRYHSRSPDVAVIRQYLKQHVKDLNQVIRNWAESP
jgi:hypothetical protein